VDARTAADRERELRRGVAEVHVGDDREAVAARAIEDDLAELV
jgi:hypothetical protein